MPWFKVDDGFWSHPKVLGLSAQAVALWVRAGSYCANHLTDGNVARGVVAVLGHSESDATELVFAGLWKNTRGGWKYNDWADYQPAREEIERQRRMKADRQKRWRESHRNQQGQFKDDRSSADSVDASVDASRDAPVDTAPTRPDPTRPKVLKERERKKRASPAPKDFAISDDMREWAHTKTPAIDIDHETERFLDYAKANGKTYVDWSAAWRNWMKRALDYAKPNTRPPSSTQILAEMNLDLVDDALATLNGQQKAIAR